MKRIALAMALLLGAHLAPAIAAAQTEAQAQSEAPPRPQVETRPGETRRAAEVERSRIPDLPTRRPGSSGSANRGLRPMGTILLISGIVVIVVGALLSFDLSLGAGLSGSTSREGVDTPVVAAAFALGGAMALGGAIMLGFSGRGGSPRRPTLSLAPWLRPRAEGAPDAGLRLRLSF